MTNSTISEDTNQTTEVPMTDLKARLDFAVQAAEKAQELILEYYQNANLEVESKSDESPVTIADRNAELLLRDEIAREFPEDGILGEEFPETKGTNDYRWILDPIDGTKSFVHGVPLFGTLIGLEHNGESVLGVCRFPALNEVVYAALGHGCWWQIGDAEPKRAQVSEISTLKESCFCTTNVSRWDGFLGPKKYKKLCKSVKLTRGWGDCFGHILVATGRAELMVDPALSLWDAAALVPILREAGGHFVDLQGKETAYSEHGLSVNGNLKETVLELLNK